MPVLSCIVQQPRQSANAGAKHTAQDSVQLGGCVSTVPLSSLLLTRMCRLVACASNTLSDTLAVLSPRFVSIPVMTLGTFYMIKQISGRHPTEAV